ncbi:30S ribosomal protein S12 methylthiotransferase RimO [Calderihabitans maritimus]|uniref:Ribosomal protein uS12 methylthiotransferase RimO n=1 Tax=Calderihabitans maritimus TaxID=1246530 RepID=A0A1Z5HPV6_9FIRM|nr:30S ribosomal protein S12 methylthiotransferase RimO [Calderihabitans maritimus]GAW91544.1 ribosomal protein S12 methylthiotransferase RimO [Calderihabitans maritimus]
MQVAIVTLGCAKNVVDSEVMQGIIEDKGHSLTDPENADFIIVNTCGFIEAAKEESINKILELVRLKEQDPAKKIILAGCLAQKYSDELWRHIPELDAVLGPGRIAEVLEVLEQVAGGERVRRVGFPEVWSEKSWKRNVFMPRSTAYLKIAEGCSNHCSYCVIPQMRGNYRSRPVESILDEARRLAANGTKEIVLIAQDTTRYGVDLYGRFYLAELLRELVRIPDISWVRLLYCYPAHFTDELIAVMAEESKICKYVDLPLQHADPDILRKMNRKGSVEEIYRLIQKLRTYIPNITLRSTFIVGFPGETEAQFSRLLSFLEEMRFDWVGAFTYSQEEGTPAARMRGQIPARIKDARYHRLMLLQREITRECNSHCLGKIMSVLIEGKSEDDPELFFGRTERQAPEVDGIVYVRSRDLKIGEFYPVRITSVVDDYDLLGEIVK